MKIYEIDEFTKHYVIAALWSSTDTHPESGEEINLDDEFSIEDIEPLTLEKMYNDCQQFQKDNAELLAKAYDLYAPREGYSREALAGHDFWLTRNHHGVGFWDRTELAVSAEQDERGTTIGDILTEQAHKFGEFSFYIGDDLIIYGS